MSEAQRNVPLDGLRGIAVGLVLLYHHALLNSGWFGVDLFFVLSGFLITTILRKGRGDAHYWREFWIKRATRILPPLVLLLLVAMSFDAVTWRWMPTYLLSLGDVMAVLQPKLESTRPLWSLGVEEHFYLLWPFAVRYLDRRRLLQMLGCILVLGPLLRLVVSVQFHPAWDWIYFLTPYRLDGISFGSLLAILWEAPEPKAVLRLWAGAAVLVSAATYVLLRKFLGVRFTREASSASYNSLGYWLLAACAFFVLAYLLSRPESLVARLLSWKPLVLLGLMSYGVYLYQVPMQRLATHLTGIPVRHVIVLSAPMTLVMAWLSFRFIETPLILWGKRKAQQLRERRNAEALSPYSAP